MLKDQPISIAPMTQYKPYIFNSDMINDSHLRQPIPTFTSLKDYDDIYQILIENMNEGALLLTSDANIMYANKAFGKIIGIEQNVMTGRSLDEFINLKEKDKFFRLFLKSKEISVRDEFNLMNNNSVAIPVCLSFSTIQLNESAVTCAIVTDLTAQKRHEDRMLREIEFTNSLINSSSDGIFAFNRDLVYTVWNPGMEKITGLSKREMLGKKTRELLPFSGLKTEVMYMQRVLKGESIVSKNNFYSTKKNQQVSFEAYYSPILGKSTEIIGGLVIVRDVTEAKKTEIEYNELIRNQLHEQIARVEAQAAQEKITNIIESITDAFIALNDQWQFTYLNSHAQIITKKNREELIGKNIFDIYPDFRSSLHYKKYQEAKQTNTVIKFEEYHKDIQKWFQVNIYPSKGNLSIYFSDITDKKHAEEAYKVSENKYKLVVEHATDLISLIDRDGRFLYSSPSHEKILGYKPQELIGANGFKYIHVEDAHTMQDLLKDINKENQTTQYTIRARHKNGTWLILEGAASAIFDEDGKTQMIVTVSRDVTERKQLEQQKDEFISIASHELKTPLTSIKGYTQILERVVQGAKLNNAETYLSRINTHINKLTGLISDLLDVSKIQGGKLQYNEEVFDFDNLIKETVENIQHTTSQHHILMQGQSNRQVKADKVRIEQVIINLLTNAIKYSPNADKVIINVTGNEKFVQLAVRDFGVGIPKDKLNHVFKRFYRVEETAKRFSGLGIGLFISSEIIQRHGGAMWVESEYEVGSIFYFTLPIIDFTS